MSTRVEILNTALLELNREDKAAYMPSWLASAEARINSAMRVEEMVQHSKLPITEMIFPLPPDFQAGKSLSIIDDATATTYGTLLYVPSEQLDAGWVAPSYGQGPTWYTTRGRNIQLANWNLSGAYTLDMWYYANWPKLVADGDHNWLSDNFPHVYIEMIKAFGFRHLQEFDNADRTLMTAMAEINAMNEMANLNKQPVGPLIMRAPRKMGGRHS
jgi:hypothetical protein